MVRRRTPVLLQVYLPSGLFVIVSWISFIVPPEVVPGTVIHSPITPSHSLKSFTDLHSFLTILALYHSLTHRYSILIRHWCSYCEQKKESNVCIVLCTTFTCALVANRLQKWDSEITNSGAGQRVRSISGSLVLFGCPQWSCVLSSTPPTSSWLIILLCSIFTMAAAAIKIHRENC